MQISIPGTKQNKEELVRLQLALSRANGSQLWTSRVKPAATAWMSCAVKCCCWCQYNLEFDQEYIQMVLAGA
jgi:hypothetical protein